MVWMLIVSIRRCRRECLIEAKLSMGFSAFLSILLSLQWICIRNFGSACCDTLAENDPAV